MEKLPIKKISTIRELSFTLFHLENRLYFFKIAPEPNKETVHITDTEVKSAQFRPAQIHQSTPNQPITQHHHNNSEAENNKIEQPTMSNANNKPILVPQHIEIEHITPSTNTGETNPPENSPSPPIEPYIINTTIIETNTQTQTAKTIKTLKTVTGTPTNATRYGLRANPATTTYQEFLTHELSKKPALARHLLKKVIN